MAATLFTVTTGLSEMPEWTTVYVGTTQQQVLYDAWFGQGQYWATSENDEKGNISSLVFQEVGGAWKMMRGLSFSEQPQKLVPCTAHETIGDMVITVQMMSAAQVRSLKKNGVTVEWPTTELIGPTRNEDMASLLLAPRRVA